MRYEFLSEYALGTDEREIDQVVNGKDRYGLMKEGNSWLYKGQVLATALSGRLEKLVKNGQKENQRGGLTEIKGFPGIVSGITSRLPKEWTGLFQPGPEVLRLCPDGSCLFRFDLSLNTPFFSREDRSFYPIDNALKREWVFEVPCLGASGVKGLLRWAWKMCRENAEAEENILFGFAPQGSPDDGGRQGALMTYPLFWDGEIGLDVINPHDRATGVGKNPISYEVVKGGAKASLCLLFVNLPGRGLDPVRLLSMLEDPLTLLLTRSGLSAKRTADWGSVTVEKYLAWTKAVPPKGGSVSGPPAGEDPFEGLIDETGELRDLEDSTVFPTKVLAKLAGESNSWLKKPGNREIAKQRIRDMWEERQKAQAAPAAEGPPEPEVLPIDKAKNIQELFAGIAGCLPPVTAS